MSGYKPVTFIGGPLDLHRVALSVNDIHNGYYRTTTHDHENSYAYDSIQRQGHVELSVRIFTYRLMWVYADVWVGVPA